VILGLRVEKVAGWMLLLLCAAAVAAVCPSCASSNEKKKVVKEDEDEEGPRQVFGREVPENVVVSEEVLERRAKAVMKHRSAVREDAKSRGRYLAESVAACWVCHGDGSSDREKMSGGRLMRDRFGEVIAANITPDKETGIGLWSMDEVVEALRSSIAKGGVPLTLDLHSGYRWMSDRDARAIAEYLFSLEPVNNAVERRELGLFQRKRLGLFPRHSSLEGYIPSFPETDSERYGKYLADHVAQCGVCHTGQGKVRIIDDRISFGEGTPYAGSSGPGKSTLERLLSLLGLSGDKEESSVEELEGLVSRETFEELKAEQAARKAEEENAEAEQVETETKSEEVSAFPPPAPDIRGSSQTGLAQWTAEDIVEYLSSGRGPGGRLVPEGTCPWPAYRNMDEGDKRAVAQYLKGL